MSLENAELTKIAINAYVTTKITFANMLAEICERIPGGDIDVVSDALGTDSRIGRKYLTGALGYGGPCFPRDNVALGFFARTVGTRAELAETTEQANRGLADKIVRQLRGLIGRGNSIAVLGLAYKPNSHVIEESQGIFLARALSKAGARVVAYDPLAGAAARDALLYSAVVLDSAAACLARGRRGADHHSRSGIPSAHRRRFSGTPQWHHGGGLLAHPQRASSPAPSMSAMFRSAAARRDAENTAALVALWRGMATTEAGT